MLRHRINVLGVVTVLALSACSTATPAPTATPEPQFPTGKFVLSTDAGVGYDFKADGTFDFYFAASEPVLDGTYTITGNQIAVVDPDETEESCMAPGLASWTYDGTTLKFAPVGDDPCDGRRETFDNTTYVRP
jgi:hypothetical protein